MDSHSFSLAAFAGGFVSGFSGFAMGLVVSGVWLHIITPRQTAALIAGYGLLTQGYGILKRRQALDWQKIWPLSLGTTIGIPMGTDPAESYQSGLSAVRRWCAVLHGLPGTCATGVPFCCTRTCIIRFPELGCPLTVGLRNPTDAAHHHVGAYDADKRERKRRRKERNRQIQGNAKRREKGAKTRAEYEANSISKAKPWETEGISRRTWYSRR